MTSPKISPPWPSGLARPKGLRAIRRNRADGRLEWEWYCRETGARLPAPAAPGFLDAVRDARRPAPAHAEGTIGAALAAWRRSPEYRGAAERTQDRRERYVAPLDNLAGKPLAVLKRALVLDIRDGMAEQRGPAAANAFVQVAATFLSWCVDRGRLEANPLWRVKQLPGRHWPAWTEAEFRIAAKAFAEPLRRAIVLAYYTGQRRGDLVGLTWAAYDGAALRLRQEKTAKRRADRARHVIPAHPALREELERWKAEATSTHILTRQRGTPWHREGLSNAVGDAVLKAGLRPGLNMHGFRKLAAINLAAAGATTREIAAFVGWDTLAMVELYTKDADQEGLATAAVHRLEAPRLRLAKG
jgi:integrase